MAFWPWPFNLQILVVFCAFALELNWIIVIIIVIIEMNAILFKNMQSKFSNFPFTSQCSFAAQKVLTFFAALSAALAFISPIIQCGGSPTAFFLFEQRIGQSANFIVWWLQALYSLAQNSTLRVFTIHSVHSFSWPCICKAASWLFNELLPF